jgi:hypothetical protein
MRTYYVLTYKSNSVHGWSYRWFMTPRALVRFARRTQGVIKVEERSHGSH